VTDAVTGPVRPRRPPVPMLVIGALFLAGFTYWSAQGFFTTGVSPCFSALPVARSAIHTKAKFVGVQRQTPGELTEDFPNLSRHMPGLGSKPACVVAFEGDFQPSQVDRPRPPTRGGRVALAVVPSGSKQVLVTVLRDSLPANFHQLLGRAHR
jgi:hypothetical protein